jgi:hypothetical protein
VYPPRLQRTMGDLPLSCKHLVKLAICVDLPALSMPLRVIRVNTLLRSRLDHLVAQKVRSPLLPVPVQHLARTSRDCFYSSFNRPPFGRSPRFQADLAHPLGLENNISHNRSSVPMFSTIALWHTAKALMPISCPPPVPGAPPCPPGHPWLAAPYRTRRPCGAEARKGRHGARPFSAMAGEAVLEVYQPRWIRGLASESGPRAQRQKRHAPNLRPGRNSVARRTLV